MSPLERLRVEKAAADCGFEMSPELTDAGMRLRSARFPESLVLRGIGDAEFALTASHPTLLDASSGSSHVVVHGYAALYGVLSRASARARTLPNRVADVFRRHTP